MINKNIDCLVLGCTHYHFIKTKIKEIVETKIKGDEWKGLLATGDIAYKDKFGYFYVIGREKRICKIYGKSINLDDIENKLSLKFKNLNITVISNDVYIYIFYNYILNSKFFSISYNFFLVNPLANICSVANDFSIIIFLKPFKNYRCI